MEKRFFRLMEDVHIPGRWELDNPVDQQGQEVWTWTFRRGAPAQVEGRLRVPLYRPGKPLDFSLLVGTAIPVVHTRVATLLTELAPGDVQLIPVELDSQPEPYFLLNVIRVVRCIDDQKSAEVRYWKPEDAEPERAGQYRAVHGLRIDPSKVGDAQVFRTWGWTGVMVVSERVKTAWEQAGVTGTKFEEV